MKRYMFLIFCFLSLVNLSCASNGNSVAVAKFTITDEMMAPIIDETFEEMSSAISSDWTQKKSKPSVLIYRCYDLRYGDQTVTVISDWCQRELTSQCVNSRQYRIIDSENIERLRNEKKFQRAGYVDDRVMVDEGRELGSNYILFTKISKYGRFDVQVTNVEHSEIIYTDSKEIKK